MKTRSEQAQCAFVLLPSTQVPCNAGGCCPLCKGDSCVRLAFTLALGIPSLARIVIGPPYLVAMRLGAPCRLGINGHRFSAFWLRSRVGLSSESFENSLRFASRIAGFFLLSELLVFSPSYLDYFGVRNKLFFLFPDVLGVAC